MTTLSPSHTHQEGDQVVRGDSDDKGWTPRSILAIMDGVNSIRWAFILLEIGEESVVHSFRDWYFMKVRPRPNKLEQLRVFWDAAGWKIGELEGHSKSLQKPSRWTSTS